MLNESGVDCDSDALGDLLDHLFAALRLHPECELGVTLVDEERMTTLHEDWMQEPGPTDVLSFPIDEVRSAAPDEEPEPGVLGDIVLCPAFARAQAAAAGRTLDDELAFLTTHGTLHLIGYDHATQEEYDAMFALQDRLLRGWRS
ncbi:MAG: rRNA maturation RNase YbeY [Actinomycetales bacterium]|nr:rRNA maturation RNase YbeY [Actinomycetales bacterium]